MNVYFADSQHLMKSDIKGNHKALALDGGGFCKANQGSLHTHLFKEQSNAHDALEDVRALRRIIFDSPLNLSKQSIVENSGVTNLSHAVENMKYLHGRHELFFTFSDKLFNSSDDNGPIKRSMAQNITGSGLSYDDLCKLYSTFGSRGVVSILSNPPSTSSSKRLQVTRTKRILAAIIKHFDEKNHKE